MKKKPRGSKPSGGAVQHSADLRGPTDADVDALVAAIARMPRSAVRAKLREYGVEPDQAVKRIRARLDETLRRPDHGGEEEEGKELTAMAAARGLATAGGEVPSFGWRSTRCIADGLRDADTRGGELAVIAHGFEHLGVEADALRSHCAADPDAVWPLIECLYEAAIVVAHIPDLWMALAGAQAQLAARLSPLHQCLLVHNARELLEGDIVPNGFVAVMSDKLAHAELAKPARALLECTVRKRTRSWHELGDPVALFTRPAADPFSCFEVMDAVGEAAASDATALRVIEELTDSLRDHSVAHFFVIGALSRFRRRHPKHAASKMAAAAESANEHGRYGLFVAAIRGYEHSFRGRRQRVVPRFDLTRTPQFVPGRPHDLDVFGELVCRLHAAGELQPQMQWANRRLEMWLSR